MFYLALTFGLEEDPPGAVARMVGMVERIGHEHGVEFLLQMTVAVTDGRQVWAFRYSRAEDEHRPENAAHNLPPVQQGRPGACSPEAPPPAWKVRSARAWQRRDNPARGVGPSGRSAPLPVPRSDEARNGLEVRPDTRPYPDRRHP
jgi:hypothetical protein